MGSGIEVVHFGSISPGPGWNFGRQRHYIDELVIICSGKLHITDEKGREYVRERGQVVLYPAGWWHDEVSDYDDPVGSIFIMFKGGALGNESCWVDDMEGKIQILGQWLCDAALVGYEHVGQLRVSYVTTIVEEFRRLRSSPAESPIVKAVRRHIQEHLSDPLTLSDLAEHACMSKCHFVKRYKQFTGRTPMAELRLARLVKAKDLVLLTDSPLKQIAIAVGIGDESQFSKLFRAQFGITPGSLRRCDRESARFEVGK